MRHDVKVSTESSTRKFAPVVFWSTTVFHASDLHSVHFSLHVGENRAPGCIIRALPHIFTEKVLFLQDAHSVTWFHVVIDRPAESRYACIEMLSQSHSDVSPPVG
jgi:hypothetical protein